VAGSGGFFEEFNYLPHLELYEEGDFEDEVPNMRWVFGDNTNNSIINRTGTANGQPSTPGLTNSAEVVVLYHWTTGEDKVTDIDVFTWKAPSSDNNDIFFNKSGVTIGGHTYLSETGNTGRAFGSEASPELSYHRTDTTEGSQVQTGSNGVGGRDETSEDVQNTFELRPHDPARWEGGGPGPGDSKVLPIDLYVEARTFIPHVDGGFPIRFISRARDDNETKVRIFDLEGRVILTVFDSRFDGEPPRDLADPGQGRFTWDGRDSNFELVKGGMYVVHFSVVNIRDGKEEVLTAPVVVGTRLSN
jgi:hypothetical protein